MADPEAIKRVIANLVDNSAEAMSGALVRELVIATALLGGRDTVELSVADTGPGVTAEVKERLFMPYFSTKQRGTGLGLAIVARIIEDHHGTIRVEENRPDGSALRDRAAGCGRSRKRGRSRARYGSRGRKRRLNCKVSKFQGFTFRVSRFAFGGSAVLVEKEAIPGQPKEGRDLGHPSVHVL